MNIFKDFPVPIGRFLQNYWFSMAMFGLVFVMILRAGWRAEPQNDPLPTHPIDKKTPLESSERPIKFTENSPENPVSDKMSYLISSDDASNLPTFDAAEATVFLKRFSKVAIIEQQKFGIPAAVILAAAMLESAAGKRDLANLGNNFFSLPENCVGSSGQILAQNGRNYARFKTPWDSFRANSLFLNEKFGGQKSAAGKTWQTWISILAKGGYSNLPNFESRMTTIITDFRLQELDK
jgi:flagellum-specific peptidoglycan hydrolase FlgJ